MKRLWITILLAACSKSSPAPTTPATPPADPEPASTAAPTEPAPTPDPAPPPAPAAPAPEVPQQAKVELAPTTKSKSKAKGIILFKEVDGGVELTATLEGLTAGKEHAWHIHEKGDCSAPDASSAGAHFNPGNHPHGAPDADARHAGDFGNVLADKQGKATKTVVIKGITVSKGDTAIVGKGFIVHAKKDDLKSQPAGNAGDRIACGVIEIVK
jgi:Cu-Zn family superoxide dismutase